MSGINAVKPLSEQVLEVLQDHVAGDFPALETKIAKTLLEAATRLKELEDAPVGFASAHHDASDNWLEVDALKEETAERFANKAIKLIEVRE